MSLTRVEVLEEVVLSCMTHAMTTEAEEIMGLLLGDSQVPGAAYAHRSYALLKHTPFAT